MTDAQRNDAVNEKDDCQCPACKMRRMLMGAMEAAGVPVPQSVHTSTIKNGEEARKLQDEGHPGIGFEVRVEENPEFPFRLKLNTVDGKTKAHYDLRVVGVLQLVEALMNGVDRVAEFTGSLPADAIAFMDESVARREAEEKAEADGDKPMSEEALAEALIGVLSAFTKGPSTGRN